MFENYGLKYDVEMGKYHRVRMQFMFLGIIMFLIGMKIGSMFW